jgi:hypothetical protein
MTVRPGQTQRLRRAGSAAGAAHGATRATACLTLLLAAGGAAGCARGGSAASRPTPVASADAGAASALAAVTQFIAAARSYDARAMSLLFGTAAGPVAARDGSADVEKRMRALACYLTHDNVRIVDDLPAVGAANRRLVTVALRQRELARDIRFTAVPTARGRWLVESFDIERLSDFCRPGS